MIGFKLSSGKNHPLIIIQEESMGSLWKANLNIRVFYVDLDQNTGRVFLKEMSIDYQKRKLLSLKS